MKKGVVCGVVDNQSASTPDKALQGLLDAEGPCDSIVQVTAVEVIDNHIVAGEVGSPGAPGVLGAPRGGVVDTSTENRVVAVRISVIAWVAVIQLWWLIPSTISTRMGGG